MVLLIILYEVVLAFESVDEILKCDHSNMKVILIFKGDTPPSSKGVPLIEVIFFLIFLIFAKGAHRSQ